MSGPIKITALPSGAPITGTELIPVVQNGNTVHSAVTDVQTYLASIFAPIAGNSGQVFNVANAVTATEAVSLGQAGSLFAPIAGNASQTFAVANATGNTQAVNLGQANGLFAVAPKINTLSANTTLNATYQGSVNNITAISTQTLPALSTLVSGTTYVIDFESQVINALVACNAADSMTVNGISAQSNWAMNPGSYLRCVGVGGAAGAWICKYIPAAEAFVNNSATDIVLHVGEKCRYAPSAIANLPLYIACGNLQRYRIHISPTTVGQALAVQLYVNNTTYANAYFYTETLVNSSAAFVGAWATQTSAITFAGSMLTAGDCNAIVNTDILRKLCTVTSGQSNGTTSFAGTIFSSSSDNTTVWSSLGTIANCPSGNVFVERIA
jgi:hypothetical protein